MSLSALLSASGLLRDSASPSLPATCRSDSFAARRAAGTDRPVGCHAASVGRQSSGGGVCFQIRLRSQHSSTFFAEVTAVGSQSGRPPYSGHRRRCVGTHSCSEGPASSRGALPSGCPVTPLFARIRRTHLSQVLLGRFATSSSGCLSPFLLAARNACRAVSPFSWLPFLVSVNPSHRPQEGHRLNRTARPSDRSLCLSITHPQSQIIGPPLVNLSVCTLRTPRIGLSRPVGVHGVHRGGWWGRMSKAPVYMTYTEHVHGAHRGFLWLPSGESLWRRGPVPIVEWQVL